jgi:hypothetical protein
MNRCLKGLTLVDQKGETSPHKHGWYSRSLADLKIMKTSAATGSSSVLSHTFRSMTTSVHSFQQGSWSRGSPQNSSDDGGGILSAGLRSSHCLFGGAARGRSERDGQESLGVSWGESSHPPYIGEGADPEEWPATWSAPTSPLILWVELHSHPLKCHLSK